MNFETDSDYYGNHLADVSCGFWDDYFRERIPSWIARVIRTIGLSVGLSGPVLRVRDVQG